MKFYQCEECGDFQAIKFGDGLIDGRAEYECTSCGHSWRSREEPEFEGDDND